MKVRLMYALLLLVVSSMDAYAQPRVSKADSVIIERYRYKLNKELVIDEVDIKDRNNRTVIDSLIGESKSRFNEGGVYYSPDKRFKVFVLLGESCGSSCYGINTGYIYLIKEKKAIQTDLFTVEKIYKLDGEKYLLIQKGISGSSIYTTDVFAATVLSIKKGKIVFHRIRYINPKAKSDNSSTDQNVSLQFEQYSNIDLDYSLPSHRHFLIFDPFTKKLKYSYILDTDRVSDKGKIYHLSGYFKYENGVFIHKAEKKKEYAK